MKTEREMFEEWYKSVESQYHKALNNYDAEFDCYTNDYIQCRYFAWQASAQRDGYKLVPLEPSEGALGAIRESVWHGYGYQEVKQHYVDIYKAMIGVAE